MEGSAQLGITKVSFNSATSIADSFGSGTQCVMKKRGVSKDKQAQAHMWSQPPGPPASRATNHNPQHKIATSTKHQELCAWGPTQLLLCHVPRAMGPLPQKGASAL